MHEFKVNKPVAYGEIDDKSKCSSKSNEIL